MCVTHDDDDDVVATLIVRGGSSISTVVRRNRQGKEKIEDDGVRVLVFLIVVVVVVACFLSGNGRETQIASSDFFFFFFLSGTRTKPTCASFSRLPPTVFSRRLSSAYNSPCPLLPCTSIGYNGAVFHQTKWFNFPQVSSFHLIRWFPSLPAGRYLQTTRHEL